MDDINSPPPNAAYIRQRTESSLVQVMSCRLLGQRITWTNVSLFLTGFVGTHVSEIRIGILSVSFKKMHVKLSSTNGGHFDERKMS